jgi:hypothetical protein
MSCQAQQWARNGPAFSLVFVIWFLVSFAASAANAQPSAMEPAAVQLAGPIVQSKLRVLVIFDFSGPGKEMTSLGQALADDLRSSLARSAAELQVQDRSRIEEKRNENSYAPEIVLDPLSALEFAKELKADAFIIGEMSVGRDNVLNVDLSAYRVANGKGITSIRNSFPLNAELAALMARNVGTYDLSGKPSSKYPNAGQGGYSLPLCVYCPRPYTGTNMVHWDGHVTFVGIVDENGRVTNIAVLDSTAGILTGPALIAVRNWKMKPATNPNGKPAAVQLLIDCTFRNF